MHVTPPTPVLGVFGELTMFHDATAAFTEAAPDSSTALPMVRTTIHCDTSRQRLFNIAYWSMRHCARDVSILYAGQVGAGSHGTGTGQFAMGRIV